ncbi:hypothetical protein [Thermomonas carbonis]|nr:hypothetical protein [Thermomonas carbonis]
MDRVIEFVPVPDTQPAVAESRRSASASSRARSRSGYRRSSASGARKSEDPCRQAKANREKQLERLGLKRTFDDLSRLDAPVRKACRGF